MRVFSPGYTTIATTTLSGTFSVTNIVPEQVVTISGTVTNAAEPASNGEFTISRVGNTNVALTVNYVIAGTAGRGADYSTNVFGIGGGTTNSVTLPIGVTSTNVVITVIDDAVGEVTETVTFTLLSSTNYVSGNNQAAIVMIVDDGVDLPNVNVSARGLGSYELIPYRPAKFLVSIGSVWGSAITANVALSGTAVSGTDYVNPATFTVTIPAGSLSTIATVTPIDNASIAADKNIIITVLNATDNSYTNIGNLIATNILRNDDYAALSSLYSESFDVDNTANWVVKFATNNDVATDFFFDYSTVGVPVAPRTVGGTTRGLRLKTHLTLPSARIGVSVAPLGQAFSGNYRLRFDSWFNFTGPIDGTGTGSTEFFLAGVGASENRTNGPFAPALGMGPAVSFGYMADGGQVAGTGQRDMGAYTNTVALEPAIGGVYLAGTNNIARDNTSPYYAEFGDLTAPAAQLIPLPGQTRTNGAGILGMCWHDIIIDKTSTNVTWTVDGLLIANVPTAVFYSTMGPLPSTDDLHPLRRHAVSVRVEKDLGSSSGCVSFSGLRTN